MGQFASSERVSKDDAAKLKLLNDDIIEAEVVLKNIEFAQKRATEIVRHQDLFNFEFAAITTITCIMVAAGSITKNKYYAIPIAPLVMWLGYRYDNAFGENHDTIKDKAEALLKSDDARLKMVGGPLTLKEIDAYRARYFR